MATTLATFAQGMAQEAGEDFGDVQVRAQYIAWCKEAYISTAATSRALWSNASVQLVTTNGVAEYTLDTSVAEIKIMRDRSTEVVLGYNTEESLARLGTDLEEVGMPMYWHYSGIDSTTTGLKVTLVPVPDAIYNFDVRVLSRPPDLGDATVIPLPPEYVELMKHHVRAAYRMNDDQVQLAQSELQVYTQLLLAYNSRYTQPRQIQSRLRIKQLGGTKQAAAASVE